jgi:hypothetical protein
VHIDYSKGLECDVSVQIGRNHTYNEETCCESPSLEE